MKDKIVDIFVPGRVCLFGEHSDWAGVYRRINADIIPGNVVISGTNQGIYAKVEPHPDRLIITSSLKVDNNPVKLDIPMDRKSLKAEAESDSLFSYGAGVAYYMLEFYSVQGLVIDNYLTTLPVKKGLSSSAAFCVLLARSFNIIYQLHLTKRAEIEAAYQGEIMTSSRCGRMDQGCAYGQVPVNMLFDGELMTSKPIAPGADFHLLIGDLNKKKDTVKILRDLNKAFPFAETIIEQNAQKYLGAMSSKITDQAIKAIEKGSAPKLGELMTEAQGQFDDHIMPMCTELNSPQLHKILSDPAINEWTWGGKGVGSQGDGSIQFVVKSKECRERLAKYLEEEYGVECFELDLLKPAVIKKVIIPVAGNGTRMFPATKAIKKCFLPIVDKNGIAKPILQVIIEEALSTGIEEVGLIINPNDEHLFTSYFTPLDKSEIKRLPNHLQAEAKRFTQLSQQISYIHQEEQAGLGHAVLCSRQWVNNEPFMLLLGDHVYTSTEERSCAQQVVDCYEQYGAKISVVGIYQEILKNVEHYGTVSGEWEKDTILKISDMAEKPTRDQAKEYLAIPHSNSQQYFCVNGIYILTPEIFENLQQQIDNNVTFKGELQLTSAIEELIQNTGLMGYKVNGKHFDTGMPQPYLETVANMASDNTKKN